MIRMHIKRMNKSIEEKNSIFCIKIKLLKFMIYKSFIQFS